MLRDILLNAIKIAAALPALIFTIHQLILVGKDTGFDKANPSAHEKFIFSVNALLGFLAEHWLFHIILCLSLSAFWTLMVAEPRKKAKRKARVKQSK